MKSIKNNITVECVKGNIVAQTDITAIVNAANARLMPGGGVAGAIHRAAGPGLIEECRSLAPIRPGEAVITRGYKLPNAYVIHCLGPIYGVDKPEDKILTDCYGNALRLAEDHKIDSICFPAISTGAFGYPMEDAAEIAFRTIMEMIPKLSHVKRIRFVLHSDNDLRIHEKVLKDVLGE